MSMPRNARGRTKVTSLGVSKSPPKLSRSFRKKRYRNYASQSCAVDDGSPSRKRRGRVRKGRTHQERRGIREKQRPLGAVYADYMFEVHLTSETLYSRNVNVRWMTHNRLPGRRRQNWAELPAAITGKHEEIIETLQRSMPVRVLRKRDGRTQKTRLFFKSESDIVILKALYAEDVWKVFRLVDHVE